MPAMREALERVRLNRHGRVGSEPRPVGELIAQQPLHAFLVDRIVVGVFPETCKAYSASPVA